MAGSRRPKKNAIHKPDPLLGIPHRGSQERFAFSSMSQYSRIRETWRGQDILHPPLGADRHFRFIPRRLLYELRSARDYYRMKERCVAFATYSARKSIRGLRVVGHFRRLSGRVPVFSFTRCLTSFGSCPVYPPQQPLKHRPFSSDGPFRSWLPSFGGASSGWSR